MRENFLSPYLMDAETATWVGIGLITALYLRNRHRAAALLKKHSVIVTNYTNDPLRWRHTGYQPIGQFAGNRRVEKFAFPQVGQLKTSMGFI